MNRLGIALVFSPLAPEREEWFAFASADRGYQEGLPMVMWSAVIVLIASVLVLGPFAESAPAWAVEAAMLTLALSAFVLVCLLEAGGRVDKRTD